MPAIPVPSSQRKKVKMIMCFCDGTTGILTRKVLRIFYIYRLQSGSAGYGSGFYHSLFYVHYIDNDRLLSQLREGETFHRFYTLANGNKC
jgi:hypothetical protein